MADEKKADKPDKGHISGMIRDIENLVNSKSSAPPDPELAAKFDAVQTALAAEDENGNGENGGDGGGKSDKAKKK